MAWLTDYCSLAPKYDIEDLHVYARSELCACFALLRTGFAVGLGSPYSDVAERAT
jgi:hypothetical protein